MAIALPPQFEQRMKSMLGEQYESFIASYEKPRKYGLRINELKISVEKWFEETEMNEHIQPIPWTSTGFYYEEQERPAKHPHYQAGLYYIQEPSAMVPVELLDVKPGHRVLDLCAAPGGKSTQIASKLKNKGVLVTNDIATERTKALAKNIELAGIRNAIILNEKPENIAQAFGQYFDRILVDAPCSGEGMFRKNEEMINQWYNYSVDRCAQMQDEILKVVAQMIAPGGKLVYSTCTFSPEENESQIANFIATHEDFDVVAIEATKWGWANGRAEWVDEDIKRKLSKDRLESINGTIRLWPHLTDGEGHFVAVLQRKGHLNDQISDESIYSLEDINWSNIDLKKLNQDFKHIKHKQADKRYHSSNVVNSKKSSSKQEKGQLSQKSDLNPLDLINQVFKNFVNIRFHTPMKAVMLGSRIYLQSESVPSLDKLKIVRAGWFIGEIKSSKYIPSQSFIMGISKHEMLKYISLPVHSEQLDRYLKGETLFISDEVKVAGQYEKQNGFAFILVNDYVVGIVKIVEQMLKNEIPAGWRQLN